LIPKPLRAIAYLYYDERLQSALYEKPRPAPPLRILPKQQRRIIAMVCGPVPERQARWSKLLPKIGRETVRVLLETHELKPWREKNVVHPQTR